MTVPDITYAIRDGRADGPDLVLIHCLGVDHRFFDPLIPALSKSFTIWRYDLPGHGQALPATAAYDIAALARQLQRFCAAFDISRAHIAGISLGGLVAQQLASSCPDLVDRLVLIDTTPRYTDEMRAAWKTRAATARQAGVRAMVADLLKIWFSAAAVAESIPAVEYVNSALSSCSGEAYALACEALEAADLREAAADIKAPTLVLCGDDDIPSFLDAARWLGAHVAGARLAWIRGTRHASILERPDAAAEIIDAFLTGSDIANGTAV